MQFFITIFKVIQAVTLWTDNMFYEPVFVHFNLFTKQMNRLGYQHTKLAIIGKMVPRQSNVVLKKASSMSNALSVSEQNEARRHKKISIQRTIISGFPDTLKVGKTDTEGN